MPMLRALLLSTRPHQWTKNALFVFPAIVFDVKLLQLDMLTRVAAACGLLILVSGSVYLINDLFDREQDRHHPSKRLRPIAAGELPVGAARLAAALLAIVGLAAAFQFDSEVGLLLAIYLCVQIAYSMFLKNIGLLDVLTVASGFVIRVLIGGVAIDVAISPWLLTFTGLLALFLAVGKRRQELVKLRGAAEAARPVFRHYNLALLDEMLRIATTSALITYILYTIEVETMIKQGLNLGFLTVPFILYGLLRYLYLLHVEEIDGAPDEVLLTDRPLQLAVLLAGVTYFVILYVV